MSRTGLTLMEILAAVSLLVILAAAATPLLRHIVAAPGRFDEIVVAEQLALFDSVSLATLLDGDGEVLLPNGYRLVVVRGEAVSMGMEEPSVAFEEDFMSVESVKSASLSFVDMPESCWLWCEVVDQQGVLLAAGPRLISGPGKHQSESLEGAGIESQEGPSLGFPVDSVLNSELIP